MPFLFFFSPQKGTNLLFSLETTFVERLIQLNKTEVLFDNTGDGERTESCNENKKQQSQSSSLPPCLWLWVQHDLITGLISRCPFPCRQSMMTSHFRKDPARNLCDDVSQARSQASCRFSLPLEPAAFSYVISFLINDRNE